VPHPPCGPHQPLLGTTTLDYPNHLCIPSPSLVIIVATCYNNYACVVCFHYIHFYAVRAELRKNVLEKIGDNQLVPLSLPDFKGHALPPPSTALSPAHSSLPSGSPMYHAFGRYC
jgi:hypothetical protein